MESDMVFIAGNLLLLISEPMTDAEGHQLPNYENPGLGNEKNEDSHSCLAAAEATMAERVKQAAQELRGAGTGLYQA